MESVPAADRPAGPALRVNEVAPGNDSLLQDELGEADDWLELYNADIADVPLDGWRLVSGGHVWPLPAGLTLAPGGHLVVWADGQPEQGALHAPFTLSDEGGDVRVVAPDGAVTDELAWPAVPDDVVWGRFPSGSATLGASIDATPGLGNPASPGTSIDPTDGMFPTDRVLRVELFADATSIDALRYLPYEYVPAEIVYDGVRMPVGIHIKGQWGSYRSIDGKAALKVDIDRYVPQARLRGLEKLTLNNMVQDRTCVHEALSYELLRTMGAPAPRVSWVELYLNGVYRGLYLNVETTDDTMLERWFDDPEGNLYEGEYGQDIPWGGWAALELDEQGANDVADRSDIAALAALLETAPSEYSVPALEAAVDLDKTLATLAGEVVLGHWDGYFYYPNNWRIYHDPSTGKFTVMTSGIDQTWAWSGWFYGSSGDVGAFLLQIPSVRARYGAELARAAEVMRAMDAPTKIAAYDALIRPYLEADPYKEFDMATHDWEVAATASWAIARPDSAIAQIE